MTIPQKGIYLMCSYCGPRRPTGNVGQQAKNSAQPFYSQARKMPFVLN
ncbi:hypothetical protein RFH07_08030 [Acinetobacter seifertii]|nr:hypothetical protein [Acinetobacter seifertii]MDQ9036552.1 hypothetical protein [Acinetobacter seifertii]